MKKVQIKRGKVIGILLVMLLSILIISTTVADAKSAGNGQKIIVNPIVSTASNNYSYSIVHISDTQFLSASYPSTLNYTFSYLESIKNSNNITAIIVTGDMVDDGRNDSQWLNYMRARSLTTIPIYEVAGNHDVMGSYSNYDKYIGLNKRNYTTVINDFLLIGIGYNGENFALNNLDIANYKPIIGSNPKKIALFAVHNYFTGAVKGKQEIISPLGSSIKNNLILQPTIVISGHVAGSLLKSSIVNNTVYIEDLTDYQYLNNYSAGKSYTLTNDNGNVSKIIERDVFIYPTQSFGLEKIMYTPDMIPSQTSKKK